MSKRVAPDKGLNAPARVKTEEMSPDQTRELLARFVREFVDPEKKESLALALRRSPVKQRPVSVPVWFRGILTKSPRTAHRAALSSSRAATR